MVKSLNPPALQVTLLLFDTTFSLMFIWPLIYLFACFKKGQNITLPILYYEYIKKIVDRQEVSFLFGFLNKCYMYYNFQVTYEFLQ